jgi:hypothetical protein
MRARRKQIKNDEVHSLVEVTSYSLMANITTDLTVRVVIITFIYSILSYFVIEKDMVMPEQLSMVIPSLFVTFGMVMMISILYDLRRYNVMNAKR